MDKVRAKAQLRYHKTEDGREGYVINILFNGEWLIDTWFPLVEGKDRSDSGAEYVHWTILLKLSELQNLGYDIDL